MMQAPQVPDAAAQKALEGLADIVVPAPVSWLPQTIGWAVVAALLAAAAVVMLWRWRRHALANRYRVEALHELAALERQLASHSRDAALVRIAELLKRTAIAAYSRDAVAQLSGAEWVAFIRQRGPQVPEEAVSLLDDLEYRDRRALAAMTDTELQAIVAATRSWIRGHRVPA
jgi:hypothetical protein